MFLNDDIVDTERPDRICSPKIVVNEFSGLFLYPSIFSIKHFWYSLNSNILVSWEDVRTLQKVLLAHTFLCDSSFFSYLKEWRQFRPEKPPWCLAVIPLNNAASFFTAR